MLWNMYVVVTVIYPVLLSSLSALYIESFPFNKYAGG